MSNLTKEQRDRILNVAMQLQDEAYNQLNGWNDHDEEALAMWNADYKNATEVIQMMLDYKKTVYVAYAFAQVEDDFVEVGVADTAIEAYDLLRKFYYPDEYVKMLTDMQVAYEEWHPDNILAGIIYEFEVEL